jgi:hypothetical protein
MWPDHRALPAFTTPTVSKAGVTLISAKKVTATSTHFGFNVLAPPLLFAKCAAVRQP